MDSYIKTLIRYFFRHDVSGETKDRMYGRMAFPAADQERDEAVSAVWEELEGASCPAGETEAAYARLAAALGHEAPTAPRRRGRRRRARALRAALWLPPAGLLCLAAWLCLEAGRARESAAAVAYTERYAAVGTRERVVLPDSSVAWLNAGSLLVYASGFPEGERRVHLSGEGFFEVSGDRRRPFTVTTRHARLTALGTSFDVSAYPEDEQVKVTLETGRLEVEIGGRADRHTLGPGEQLVYTPSTGGVERRGVRAADYSEWRTGGLHFDNVPLADVLRSLERAYGVRFHPYTSAYLSEPLRVRLEKGETLERAMRILKMLVPQMDYRIEGGHVYLE